MSNILESQFTQVALLEQALRHRSAGKPNNERFEFLGDAILGFVISKALFQKFPKASEGDLTLARSLLVRETCLAEIARENNIGEMLELGSGEMKTGGHRRDSILADAVEAIIAAKFLDSGIDSCTALIHQWFGDRLQMSTAKQLGKDPKTRLQEWLQSKQHSLPVYQLVQATGSDHQREFEVYCTIEKLSVRTHGKGTSVKSAEAEAAKQALIQLGQDK